MVGAGDGAQLAALKAVEPGYPLRGALRVASAPFEPDAATRDIPPEGAVWVDGQLLSLLNLKVGDTLPGGLTVVGVTESTVTLADETGSERTLSLR